MRACAKMSNEIFRVVSLHTTGARQRPCERKRTDPRAPFFTLPSAVDIRSESNGHNPIVAFQSRKDPHITGEYTLKLFPRFRIIANDIFRNTHHIYSSRRQWYAASQGYDMKTGPAADGQMPPSLAPMPSGFVCGVKERVRRNAIRDHQSLHGCLHAQWYYLRKLVMGMQGASS